MLGATLFPLRFSCRQIQHHISQQDQIFRNSICDDVCGLRGGRVMAKQKARYVNDKGGDTPAR